MTKIYWVKGPHWKELLPEFEEAGYDMKEVALGNMRELPVEFPGVLFKTSEAAYQSSKFSDPNIVVEMAKMGGVNAKRYAYHHQSKMIERSDEDLLRAMISVLREKAIQHSDWADLLISTRKDPIIELSDNKWGAKIVKGKPKGSNLLGKALMQVRKELEVLRKGGHELDAALFPWGENIVRLVIYGSRGFKDYDRLKAIVDMTSIKESGIHSIVCGEAIGADSLGRRYGEENGIRVESYPPDWKKYSKSAAFKRNTQMSEVATHGIAFWDGTSKGTSHMTQMCKKNGVKGFVYNYITGKVVKKFNVEEG